MDRRRFALSLALVPFMPLIPPMPHTRMILPKDYRVCELLEHLKHIAHQGHYHDSMEFRVGDGRRLALDTSLSRRRVIEYDFTRGADVKTAFYTEASLLSSSVTPEAYYLFVCSLIYAARPLFGPVEESKTVCELMDTLPSQSTNLFAKRLEGAAESLRRRLTEETLRV